MPTNAFDLPLSSLLPIPLFHDLTLNDWLEVRQAFSLRTCSARTEVISAHGRCGELLLLLTGSVKVIARNASSEMLLNILGPGEVLGELSLLDGLPHSATVVTLEVSTFACITATAFDDLLQRVPTLSLNLNKVLARRLRCLTTQTQAIATLDVSGRLARQLLCFAREYGLEVQDGLLIPLLLTQNDLASLTGSTREQVNRVLHRFKNQGCLSLGMDRHIILHDLAALEKFCR